MRIEELEHICTEAARDLAVSEDRPLPAAVVLPLPDATRIVRLPDFPSDDATRHHLLERLAEDRLRPANAPCYGFVAEAELDNDGERVDVVMVVFGARQHPPQVAAAVLDDGGLGAFTEAEDLDPQAMTFLAPLQQAVDAAGPPDVTRPVLPS